MILWEWSKLAGVWFGWDDTKSDTNFRIRGFDFEAATESFFDEYAEFSYNMMWQGEDRYQVIGRIPVIGIVVVIFAIWYFEEGNEKVYRIISARRANKTEENRYRVRFQ